MQVLPGHEWLSADSWAPEAAVRSGSAHMGAGPSSTSAGAGPLLLGHLWPRSSVLRGRPVLRGASLLGSLPADAESSSAPLPRPPVASPAARDLLRLPCTLRHGLSGVWRRGHHVALHSHGQIPLVPRTLVLNAALPEFPLLVPLALCICF